MAYCPECGAELLKKAICDSCGGAVPGAGTLRQMEEPDETQRERGVTPRRLLAGAADLIPVALALGLIGFVKLRVGIVPRGTTTMLFALPLAFLLLRDSLRGMSPGKLLFGLRTLQRETGEPAGVPESVLRNAPIAVALLAIVFGPLGIALASVVLAGHVVSIVTIGRGITDRIGGTEVRNR